jgi:sterol desaturase/sphingolipid hydroxylase (fatty acid hydroxylase superfamily)
MLIGINGIAIYLVGSGYDKWILAPLLILAIFVAFAVERIIPYRDCWNSSHGDITRDACHAFVNEGVNVAGLLMLPLVAQSLTVVQAWPSSLPFAIQIVIALLVLDCGITLAHFASHKSRWLWRFHAVHHSVKRFYGFNGLMKHPIHQLIETSAGAAPLLIIGVPSSVFTAVAFCVVVQLLLQHSNADYRTGIFKYILALNCVHRFHHLKWPGVGDVNFGLVTTLWDHLLGTFVFDPIREFNSEVLGIETWPSYPQEYIEQLAAPFRPEFK